MARVLVVVGWRSSMQCALSPRCFSRTWHKWPRLPIAPSSPSQRPGRTWQGGRNSFARACVVHSNPSLTHLHQAKRSPSRSRSGIVEILPPGRCWLHEPMLPSSIRTMQSTHLSDLKDSPADAVAHWRRRQWGCSMSQWQAL